MNVRQIRQAFAVSFAALIANVGAAEECPDGFCPLPTAGEAMLAVVSPVPRGSIKPIDQAPRLDTLSGKTIAVVGHNFMARVTHPEIKRLILEKYPTAKVILK